MAELLEAWTIYRVYRAEKISSTSIGPELDNYENEMEKPEVDNVEEDQNSILKKPKVDEVEEDQAAVPSKKQKNDKDDASITLTKKLYSWQGRNIKGNMVREANASITPTKNKIGTVDKIE